ncbi:hypothetical protein SLEP1_g47638 [Rubroshorea leprosula]|uniref:Uncharacterized protein n=1 Tax=Rubroshorea leprosula TaxID=152421 RepID=A0AAV5LRA3_9ROSI|nr:hypothetical protein SLEP1_g47638 [Rubroshorea leprosula]
MLEFFWLGVSETVSCMPFVCIFCVVFACVCVSWNLVWSSEREKPGILYGVPAPIMRIITPYNCEVPSS